jgi:hypothetical protein
VDQASTFEVRHEHVQKQTIDLPHKRTVIALEGRSEFSLISNPEANAAALKALGETAPAIVGCVDSTNVDSGMEINVDGDKKGMMQSDAKLLTGGDFGECIVAPVAVVLESVVLLLIQWPMISRVLVERLILKSEKLARLSLEEYEIEGDHPFG